MPSSPDRNPVSAARVLLVSANPDLGRQLRAALADRVTDLVVVDGQAAVWRQVNGAPIDLAYIDLADTGAEGTALLDALRQNPRTRHLPLIVLAPSDRTELLRAALDNGASAFLLHKIDPEILPVHFDYVLRHARKWVREHVKRETADAKCRARDAFLGGACGESLAAMRQIGEMAVKALRSKDGVGAGSPLVAGLRAIDAQTFQFDRMISDAMEAAADLDRSVALAVRPALLSLIVTDALAEIVTMGASRSVSVVTSLPSPDVVVTCDDDAMTEALQHLLRNAVTHAPTGSKVEVDAKLHDDGMLTISVSDRGHGMSPEFVARCLTPLAADLELGPPRQRIGRGLPMAKAIAEAHGGKLEIRTNLRAGTMAMIVIPSSRVHPAEGSDGSQPSGA